MLERAHEHILVAIFNFVDVTYGMKVASLRFHGH